MVCCAAGLTAPEDITFSSSCRPSMDIGTQLPIAALTSCLSIYYRST